MKKIGIVCGMIIYFSSSFAQGIRKDAQIRPTDKPVYNPNQLPNYYQNNSSYNNNSMQNNRPGHPNNSSFPGNGNYVDPIRFPPGTYLGNGSNQFPTQGPVNNVFINGKPASTRR